MDKRAGNRGLSTVVATLIIILLTLVAIGIVWIVVRAMIFSGTEGIEAANTRFELGIASAVGFYINNNLMNVTLTVHRSPGGGDLTGIEFIFLNKTQSVNIDQNTSMKELGTENFVIDGSLVPKLDSGDIISIAPIYLSSSGKKVIGQPTDSFAMGNITESITMECVFFPDPECHNLVCKYWPPPVTC